MLLTLIIAISLATLAAWVFIHLNNKPTLNPEDKFSEWEESGVAIFIWAFVGFCSFVLVIFPVLAIDNLTANYHYGYTQDKQNAYSGVMRSFKLEKVRDNGSSGEQVKVRFNLDSSGDSELSVYSGLSADYGVDSHVTKEISCQEIKSGELPHVELFHEEKHRVNDSILSVLTEFTSSETVKERYVFYSPNCNHWSAWENTTQV